MGRHLQPESLHVDAASGALGPLWINSSWCSILSKPLWLWAIFRCSMRLYVVYMWCCGSGGCGLFIMTWWQVYCDPVCRIKSKRCHKSIMSTFTEASGVTRTSLDVFRGKFCRLGFIGADSSAVSSDSLSAQTGFLPVSFKSETTSAFLPSRVWVWSMIEKNNKLNQTSSWEASLRWVPGGEMGLSHPKWTFSPFLSRVSVHPGNAASWNGKINIFFFFFFSRLLGVERVLMWQIKMLACQNHCTLSDSPSPTTHVHVHACSYIRIHTNCAETFSRSKAALCEGQQWDLW